MSQTKVQLINNVSGDSGFGTSSPAEKLVVNGAIVASGAVSNPSSYTDTGLYIQNKGSSIFDIGAWRSGASVSELSFSTDSGSDAAPVERMRLDKDGKLGIGTTSPSQQLTMASSGDSKINIKGHGSSTGYFIGMPSATNAQVWNAENGYIQFATNDTERMRIDSNGKITVNTTSTQGGYYL